jgi:hypothetical protein
MSELATQPSQGIQLLAQLEQSGAITATALVLPPDTPYEQCEALAAMFGQLHRTSAWLIGDLLNHIERAYGETYAQAAEATGLSKGTLMNYTSVCSHIPRSRRRASLPFSTHAEVAYLPPVEQEEWLKKASDRQWTKAELRAARLEDVTPAVVECTCPTCGNVHSHPAE